MSTIITKRKPKSKIGDTQDLVNDRSSVLWLENRMSPDEAEGLLFLAQNITDRYAHISETVLEQLQILLQLYQDSVFKECEFPPYPPTRDVGFLIHLEPGDQTPASPVHKLAPALALVEKLSKSYYKTGC